MSREEPISFESLLMLADDVLVIGHRLSEWCGHGPYLEQDIAFSNLALDCLGQAQFLLEIAAAIEGLGKSADELAFFRDETQFKNCLLVEQENGDFAVTMLRHLFFSAYYYPLLEQLGAGGSQAISDFAKKAIKEVTYHLRHSSEWVIRLGDGTEKSSERAQNALNSLWRYTFELYNPSIEIEGVDYHKLKSSWFSYIEQVLDRACLKIPEENLPAVAGDGRSGRHTEYLGHLLAEMQIVARSHPGAEW